MKQTKRQAASVGPRSLNISVRKRENDRIERENQAFAKRLFQNSGSISKRKHDIEATQNEELRERIRKVKKPLPNLTGARNTQLPPLDNGSTFNHSRSRRSFSTTNQMSSSVIGQNAARRTREGMEAQQNSKGVAFATPGEMGGVDSAGVIPINSMYDGEEERKA